MRASLMKSVAAACLACAFAAQAAPVSLSVGKGFDLMDPAGSGRSTPVLLTGGSGSWELSNGGWAPGDDVGGVGGLVGVLNVLNAKVEGLDGLYTIQQLWPDPGSGDVYRTGIQVPTRVASVGLDNVTGQFTSISNVGGLQLTAPRITGILTGGTATITNLRFDLVNKTVLADLSGVKSAVGTSASVTYNLPEAALWTFASITGPLGVPVDGLLSANPPEALAAAGFELSHPFTFASTLTISGLSITSEGYNFLADSLGLGPTGKSALSQAGTSGSIQTRLVFSSAVPEPSTYLLCGIGLVGLGIAARRQRSH